MNVHLFDTKLETTIECVRDFAHKYTGEQLDMQILRDLQPVVAPIYKQLINTADASNIDSVNNVSVNDILPAVYMLWSNVDFRVIFAEQLADMRTGMCAQGRTIRIVQTVYAFISKSGNSK